MASCQEFSLSSRKTLPAERKTVCTGVSAGNFKVPTKAPTFPCIALIWTLS